MIVNQVSSGDVIKSSNITQSTDLRFKATGKAFRAVIDTIYKDKVGSIVRELSANALDAHKMKGNLDRPFVIHMPSVYESYFSIRDYGCSMSHDQIINTYSVLFESSKDTANDQVGGFGLGGKNFLSYQDSGTIVAYLNGSKRSYILMYDEHDMPKIHLVHEESTTEEDGLYVEIAVKSSDHHLFKKAVSTQLRWLKVKPLFKNVSSDEVLIKDITVNDQYGDFYTFSRSYLDSNFYIVQGEFGYPLNLNELEQHIKDKSSLEFFSAMGSGVLNFPIGDIHVTLSREDIQYDRHTIASIEKFVEKHAKMIGKGVVEELDKLPTLWDKLVLLNTDYQKKSIAKLLNYDIKDDHAKILKNNGTHYSLDLDNLITKQNSPYYLAEFKKNKKKFFGNRGAVFTPSTYMTVFVRDIGNKATSKLRWWYASKSVTHSVYIFEHREGYTAITDKTIKELEQQLGGCKVIRLSTLEDAPKNSKANNKSPVVYSYSAVKNIPLDTFTKWIKIYDEEDIEKGYYLTFERYPIPDIDASVDKDVIRHFITQKLDKSKDVIYLIKKTKMDLFKDNPNFISLEDKIKEYIKEINEKYEASSLAKRYSKALAVQNITQKILQDCNLDNMMPFTKRRLGKEHQYFGTLMRANVISEKYVDKAAKKIAKLSQVEQFIINNIVISSINNDDLTKGFPSVKDIITRYPHVKWIGSGYWSHNVKDKEIMDYIHFIDKVLDLTKKDSIDKI